MALKDEELKEFISYTGIDVTKVESLEKAKEQFAADFLRKSTLRESQELKDAMTGAFASIKTAIKRSAKDHGLEIPKEELEGKRIEDIVSYMDNGLKTLYTTKIKEAEENGGKGVDERIAAEQEKFKKLNEKHSQTLGLMDGLKLELETTKKGSDAKLNEYKIQDKHQKALGSIKFSDEAKADDLKIMGFKTVLAEKYAFDIDEAGTTFIKDKATGQRIPNPKKAGTFLEPEDVYNLEAEQRNLTSKVDTNQKTGTFVKKVGSEAVVIPETPKQNRRMTFSDRSAKQ